jgi:hypothetical protein
VSREKEVGKEKKGFWLRRGWGRLSWKEKKGFTQIAVEKRGSRRLPQVRAQTCPGRVSQIF